MWFRGPLLVACVLLVPTSALTDAERQNAFIGYTEGYTPRPSQSQQKMRGATLPRLCSSLSLPRTRHARLIAACGHLWLGVGALRSFRRSNPDANPQGALSTAPQALYAPWIFGVSLLWPRAVQIGSLSQPFGAQNPNSPPRALFRLSTVRGSLRPVDL